ncbi:MAG: asparagine synthetase B [Candidatus Eisenbacteria bacterium]|nr:asparagine synthetase B [Candidatus Eisenbacteria bacterium]
MGERRRFALLAVVVLGLARSTPAESVLVPMDGAQGDHLRAYGLAYQRLQEGSTVEWLLNYRAGSFLMPATDSAERQARLLGVTVEILTAQEVTALREAVAAGNMDAILLEKAPRIAVYCPPDGEPWDDAVRLALEYARIPYETIWDSDVLAGALERFDWLHLHHEDFTGQYGKFYGSFARAPWYIAAQLRSEEEARSLGFAKVSQEKAMVSLAIRHYVEQGGFLFAMCSATDTIDIALSALNTDVAGAVFDGDPPAADWSRRLDFSATFAFRDFRIITDPMVYEFSDIDTTPSRAGLSRDIDRFRLFEFSARMDPVPCMLTQSHEAYVRGFMGQTTGFRTECLKSDVIVMGETPNIGEAKYIHGNVGRGTFTFLGGHDPEDYQHLVGDPPTELALTRNSPGYRLILNNVLFPAARKQERKT